jgi:hypothetical protein
MAIGKAVNSTAADNLRANQALTFVVCMRNLPRDDLFSADTAVMEKVYARLREKPIWPHCRAALQGRTTLSFQAAENSPA